MYFTQGKTDCVPASVDYDDGRLTVLTNHFQKLVDDGEIQCALYCLSRRGKVFASGAVGKKSFRPKDETPAESSNIQYVASVTKVFTALAVMKLVEDGLTSLNQPVGQILPQFDSPPFNTITLFHLLTHTSGMQPDWGTFPNRHGVSPGGMIESGYDRHIKNGNPPEDFDWIAATLANGVRTKPGVEWAYCTHGFVILGAVIEKLTGVFANTFIEENIVKPLKMFDTGFRESLTPEQARRFIVEDPRGEERLNGIIKGERPKEDEGSVWSKIKLPGTGGGLHSTPHDLIRFAHMMLNMGTLDGVRIIGRKAVEKMTAQAIFNVPDYTWGGNNPDRVYGVGFDMRRNPDYTYSLGTYNHEGAGACALYIDPKEELAAAWVVPFAREGWFQRALVNVVNIVWSGLR